MSKDCLYKQLKGSLDNSDLPIFGALEFYVNAGVEAKFNLGGYPFATTITVEGDGVLKNNSSTSFGKTYVHSGGSWGNGPTKVVATGRCKVRFLGQKYTYDYLSLDGVKIDPNTLIYNTPQGGRAFNTLQMLNSTLLGDIDVSLIHDVSNTFGFVGCSGGKVYGKIRNITGKMYACNKAEEPLMYASDLEGKSSVTRIAVPLEGDIKYLGDTDIVKNSSSFPGGTGIYLHGIDGSFNENTWTTGSIEDLVARFISNGKTLGYVNLQYPKNFENVTFDGIPLSECSSQVIPTNTSNSYFHWDAQGNITWG